VSSRASIPIPRQFNDAVQLDVGWFRDAEGRKFPALVVVDCATRYGIVSVWMGPHLVDHPGSVTAKMIRDKFEDTWMEFVKCPGQIEFDQAGAHQAEMLQVIELMNITPVPVPRDAHWKLGICERRIETVKDMLKPVREERQPVGAQDMKRALQHLNSACNELGVYKGFSPEQWVLGIAPRLPGSVMMDPDNVVGHQEAVDNPLGEFAENLNYRESARRAFHKTDNSEALRRTLLQPPRRLPPTVSPGSICHFWRWHGGPRQQSGAPREGRWYGPARAIGKDIKGIWLIYRGTPTLVAAEQPRMSTSDEKQAWREVRDALLDPRDRDLRGRGYWDARSDEPPDDGAPPGDDDGPPEFPPDGEEPHSSSSSGDPPPGPAGRPRQQEPGGEPPSADAGFEEDPTEAPLGSPGHSVPVEDPNADDELEEAPAPPENADHDEMRSIFGDDSHADSNPVTSSGAR